MKAGTERRPSDRNAEGIEGPPTGGTPYGVSRPVLGGECIIRNLAAGTYDFSVQFKATAGSVTVKERALTVAVEGF